MEYYSTIKNEDILTFANKWMELENIILSEVTQTKKDRHVMHLLMSIYHACPFRSELPHSGYFLVPSICLKNSGCLCS